MSVLIERADVKADGPQARLLLPLPPLGMEEHWGWLHRPQWVVWKVQLDDTMAWRHHGRLNCLLLECCLQAHRDL